jgi:hypothetical protein
MRSMQSINATGRVAVASLLLGTLTFGAPFLPNGTEALGPAVGITVAPGSDFLMAGTGLRHEDGLRTVSRTPGVIALDVPVGVTIEQVLLYWEGQASTSGEQGATDTITVNSRAVIIGDRIGGATNFYAGAWSSSYRADITSLGLVTNGSNQIHVSGTDFGNANNGAGLLVIVNDGATTSEIQIQDGNDCAYHANSAPLDSTVPVTYTFAPELDERQAKIGLFLGSAGSDRPSIVTIAIDGAVVDTLIDVVNDGDGAEWDTVPHSFPVPAGASSVTLQCFSEDSGIGPFAGANPVSLTWVTAGFRLEQLAECSGRIGDFIWEDANEDGLQDPDEMGIPGVVVMLQDASGLPLGATTTNSHGAYFFEDLCAGDYLVEVDPQTLPSGYVATLCEQGNDPSFDSNCAPAAVTLLTDSDEDLTIDFGFIAPSGGGEDGCSHGYWKQPQHFDSWAAPYQPDDLFSDHFEDAFPGKTLIEVLWLRGGGLKALGRETVAALLNAAAPGVDFELTEAEVVSLFNGFYPGGDYNSLKDLFEAFNTIGCPLN